MVSEHYQTTPSRVGGGQRRHDDAGSLFCQVGRNEHGEKTYTHTWRLQRFSRSDSASYTEKKKKRQATKINIILM